MLELQIGEFTCIDEEVFHHQVTNACMTVEKKI